MEKKIKWNYTLFISSSRSMNLFVFLKGKYGESLILKWVYLIIPIVYEVGIFLIVIMDGVFFDQNNEFFSYTRDISNSVVMSILFILSYYVSGYYYNKVVSAMECCVKDDGLKNELKRIENRNEDCEDTKKKIILM